MRGRADLVLFVTSVERPFSDSERAFLRSIRDWHKKVLVVLNKWDLLDNDQDQDQVCALCCAVLCLLCSCAVLTASVQVLSFVHRCAREELSTDASPVTVLTSSARAPAGCDALRECCAALRCAERCAAGTWWGCWRAGGVWR